MNPLLIASVRLYLRTLAAIAPRIAGREAYRLFSTPRLRSSVPSKAQAEMARAERFDIEAGEHRIAAYRWRVADPAAAAPRVMLVHGWESRAGRLAVWVAPLREAGYEVVAFDAPAHGESSGRTANPLLFVEALQAVIAQVGPVSACVGHSLGGYASLLAASGGSVLDRDNLAVDRLIVIAGADSAIDAMQMFCDFLGLGDGFLPRILDGAAAAAGRPIADFNIHRLFPERQIPTLWLHDPEDDEVPFEAAQRVADACSHVRLEQIDGLGHHLIARDPAIISLGLEFLAGRSPASAAA